ncbi:Acetyl-CoA:oxalate CoA-transferase [Alphaproteobacteria bacterium SO-S41]|nr:Acetyl-CoA:oxalate CoA-transferase [Alphaproteobacteria bacterium SO-S41]
MRALEGITVIDLTHMLSGPYGTMLMADLGARTIKVEPPGKGEGTRRLLEKDPDYSRDGMGAYFLTLCRNKESVALDLKSDEGRALFYELVKHADVVVSNFGVGVVERLKIDYHTLAAYNPRIITCAISGFGETGPCRDWPSFDLVAQGMGGGMSLTGIEGGDYLRSGIPIGDLGGGMFGVIGILAALQARHVTGVGQHIDISMLDCQLSMLNYIGTMNLMSGKMTERVGNGHFVHVPYNAFRTTTRPIIIAVITDNFWATLVDLLGDDALRREEFLTQPARLREKAFIEERVQAAFATQSCEYWMAALQRARIPAAPVNDVEQAFAEPQAAARNMKVKVQLPSGDWIDQPGNPVKLSVNNEERYTTPPGLVGRDTRAVLTSMLGLDEAQLTRLAKAGTIGLPA